MSLKFKYIALDKTINIITRNMQKSPERCTRNLLELGAAISKNSFDFQRLKIYNDFIELCKNNDKLAIKELFYSSFLE